MGDIWQVRGECTEAVWEGVRSSIEMAQKRKDLVQVEVQPQHLMKVLLEQQNGLAVGIFNRVGVDTTRLLKATDERIQLQPQPMAMVWPKDVKQKCGFSFLAPVIERARAFRKEFGDTELSVEHLVLGFFEDAKFGKRLYQDFRISFNALKTAIGAIRRIQSVIHQVADGKYGKDLTAMASAGNLDPVIGRDDEIRRCIQILCRRTKNNPILIGEPGVGKTAISEGLAQRIVKGDVPQELTNRRLISLDMGTRYSGDFEAWLISLLEKVTKCNGQIILFIDDIHTVFGAEHSMGVGNLLQSMLGREELRCIGATTFDEYRKYIEKHPALERRFRQVYVDQPSREDTISILRGLRERFELHHGVSISDNSLVSAVDLSNRYISKRFLPDKAIDLVDEAAAKLKIEMTSRPTALDDINRALLNLEMEKHSLMKDRDKASTEKAQRVEAQLSLLKCQLEVARREAKDCNKSGKSTFREEVTADDIAEIVNKWTGIPLCNLKQSEMMKLLHLEEDLHKRFVGQDRAVKAVAEAIQRSQAGLSVPHRPITSFMFLGPTGVGKTELAKALAAHLFNTEEALVRIDMSEYMEKHAVSRLIEAPPGYLGYGEGGQLTETIRRRPYAVILFDEIEQAHPDVFNLFIQILDDGRLTNSQGRVVDFTHTVIIMTSNVGSEYISGTKKMASYETMKQQVMEAAKAIFRPEFMNRVDEFIVFQTLDRDQINKIVRLQLGRVQHRLAERKIRIEATDAAVELIGKLGYDPTAYGARPVRRVIQQHVENELAKGILRGDFKEDDDTLVLIDTEVTASGNWRLIQQKLVFKKLGSASYVHPSSKGNSNIYALKNVFFNICIVYFLKLFGMKAPM